MENTKLFTEYTDQDYDISKEDIYTYAEQIGIDTIREKHLMWIAEKGLSEKVPKPWLILSDKKERIFYYNPETQEKSWSHPLDKEYSSLVSEERSKSKSLNSASTDYGFESKLSSLADAPPLSSSGKNSPSPLKRGKTDGGLSGKKFEFGRIENRRGTQLAPVRLNSLKMPPSTAAKSSIGMSFMPKGTTLAKRRYKEEANDDDQIEEGHHYDEIKRSLSHKKVDFDLIKRKHAIKLAPIYLNTGKMTKNLTQQSSNIQSYMPKTSSLKDFSLHLEKNASHFNKNGESYKHDYHADESNESLNSDEGSKYSYEASDDEEKHSHALEPFDMIDASQLSPMHSADESPDALEINSLVQLGTKTPSKLDSSLRREKLESVKTREISPSLSLRKVGQPTFLKPLTQTTKKKTVNKTKTAKKAKSKYLNESETFSDDKISATNDEQRLMLETLQKEWLAMQDEVEKQEKEKYEAMLKDSLKKLEEEEVKLRNENSEKISKIKNELQKKIEDEESAGKKHLQELQASNQDKIFQEEKRLQKELENLSTSLKDEFKKLEEKNASELAMKKKELEEIFKKEIDDMKILFDSKKKSLEESHGDEISVLEKVHKQKIEEMKSEFEKEMCEVKEKVSDSSPKLSESQIKLEELKKSVEDETEKYQQLLKDKENILKEIKSEKDSIENLKKETSELQRSLEETHDEIDKTENELDSLRLEKSALISELNILKENIKNEKSNLEKKSSSFSSKPSDVKKFSDSCINTYSSFFDTICTAVQVSQSYCDVSSQVDSRLRFMSDAICQTAGQPEIYNKSCQTDSQVSLLNDENALKFNSEKNKSSASDKALENALSDLSVKMDSRINVIENHIRSLQENFLKSASAQTVDSNHEYVENQFTDVNAIPNSENRIPPVCFTDNFIPPGVISNPLSSQIKCRCELGDPASCDVLQEVKNSVYRLNEILCANYVPPLRFNSLCEVSHPVNNYSSPFDNFYTEFRQMQEKHRLTELKHKCENGTAKFSSGTSMNKGDDKTLKSFTHDHWKSSHHVNNPNIYSHTMSEDPLIRAKNIVLREQARAWKEQQTLSSYVPHISPLNSTSERSQSSTDTLAALHTVPSPKETYFHFEVDPEADYQTWMMRLNALQLRIKSHKLL